MEPPINLITTALTHRIQREQNELPGRHRVPGSSSPFCGNVRCSGGRIGRNSRSVRVSRAGERAWRSRTFSVAASLCEALASVSASRRNKHASRVCSPEFNRKSV